MLYQTATQIKRPKLTWFHGLFHSLQFSFHFEGFAECSGANCSFTKRASIILDLPHAPICTVVSMRKVDQNAGFHSRGDSHCEVSPVPIRRSSRQLPIQSTQSFQHNVYDIDASFSIVSTR